MLLRVAHLPGSLCGHGFCRHGLVAFSPGCHSVRYLLEMRQSPSASRSPRCRRRAVELLLLHATKASATAATASCNTTPAMRRGPARGGVSGRRRAACPVPASLCIDRQCPPGRGDSTAAKNWQR